MKIATIHQDNISRLYCAEIQNDQGQTALFKMSKLYSELLNWARENEARIIDLDKEEDLEDYL